MAKPIILKSCKALIALALTCAVFAAWGFAASERTTPPLSHILDINLAINPVNMVSPGDATITLSIKNNSDYDAENVYFTSSDGLHAEPLGLIPAGDAQVFTRAYTVSQEELDAGKVYFVVSHDDISGAETLVNYTVETAVARAEPAPKLELTRRFSARSVTAGSTVTVIYRVRNAGNVALSQIRLTDAFGEFTGRAETLEPGQSKLFSSRVTVNFDAVSSAEVTCACDFAEDGEMAVRLDDAPISVISPTLSVALTLDKMSAHTGDTVSGVIVVAASGADFSSVTIEDVTYGTLIADSLSVKGDGVRSVGYSWPVRESAEYSVRVTGVSASGEVTSAVSNSVLVSLEGEDGEGELSVSASAPYETLSSKGYVRVTVAIVNPGKVDATNVTLSEKSMGDIRTFDFIPAGDPTYREVLCRVERDSSFVFSISYENGSGAAVTASSQSVDIKIAAGGAEPEAELEKTESGIRNWVANQFGGDRTFVGMLVASGVVLLALLAALIVTSARERRARREKAAQEKRRKHDEMSRTSKFVPIKKQNRQS